MGLDRRDKEFRHEGISYLDYKQVEMDRVLTAFLARLQWGGQRSVISRTRDLTVGDFVATFQEHPEAFADFDPAVARRWVETHLVDMVSRGKPGEAVAGLRPLHGFTYRFRNARRSRAYGADEQLYEMLSHADVPAGPAALDGLKDFFFSGVDPRTETPRLGADIDVETQALISLSEAVRGQITDRPVTDRNRRSCPPLCREASNLLANDVLRLLLHWRLIPRSVLVDHLKILFAFHLALYQLKILKLLPAMIRGEQAAADGSFFLDVTGLPGTGAARLAEVSAAAWFGRIPEFVRATFTVKKLDDLAEHMARRGQLSRPPGGFFPVSDLLALLGQRHHKDRSGYAAGRLSAIEASRPAGEDEDPVVAQLLALGLDEFTAYIEVVTYYRVKFHRRYLTECLDSLLLKNRPGAMIAQPRSGMRRFTLDSRLLEVLLQLALLSPVTFETVPLRVDEFLAILRDRYGLCVDQLPDGDGFRPALITDHGALRDNRAAFIARLREIGFYSDLSDAYLTQTITPRYVITASSGAPA
jgi:hypothetical protein